VLVIQAVALVIASHVAEVLGVGSPEAPTGWWARRWRSPVDSWSLVR